MALKKKLVRLILAGNSVEEEATPATLPERKPDISSPQNVLGTTRCTLVSLYLDYMNIKQMKLSKQD